MDQNPDLLRVRTEGQCLAAMDHQHIVKLIDSWETDKRIFIITELAEDGDLLEYIHNFGVLSEEQLTQVMITVVDALAHAHSRGYAHLDVKPDNLLIDKDRIILADWGFATPLVNPPAYNLHVGTRGYSAPEVIALTPDYDARKADCWSLGVTLYALAAGVLPFDLKSPDMEGKILSGIFMMPAHFSERLKFIIGGLLCVDPRIRLTLRVANLLQDVKASDLYFFASGVIPAPAIPLSRSHTPPVVPSSSSSSSRSIPRSVGTTSVCDSDTLLSLQPSRSELEIGFDGTSIFQNNESDTNTQLSAKRSDPLPHTPSAAGPSTPGSARRHSDPKKGANLGKFVRRILNSVVNVKN